MDVVEITYPIGERVEREFTADEKAQRKIDEAAAKKAADEVAAKAAAAAIATSSAIAHAKSLGFTDEMIAVMYPALIIP